MRIASAIVLGVALSVVACSSGEPSAGMLAGAFAQQRSQFDDLRQMFDSDWQALGRTIFFHGSYADSTAVHAWRRGSREAVRIASFAAALQGLAAGWFLARDDGQVARVRFEAPVFGA